MHGKNHAGNVVEVDMMGTSCKTIGAEAITQRFLGKGRRWEVPTRGKDRKTPPWLGVY